VADKLRVAFFDFACCEGCQLTVLGIGEPLLDLLAHVDVVMWREAMSEKTDRFDVAVVEGSLIPDSEVPRLQWIREQAKVLIGLGSCANLGGPHVSANLWDPAARMEIVFGAEARHFETGEVRPLSAIVPVDIPIYGCPISPDDFANAMKHLLLGLPYPVPNQAVCYECKRNQYECVYDRGMICLGPVTRCGCNAICTSKGHRCFGCRGPMEQPNARAAHDVLLEYGYTVDELLSLFRIYWQQTPEDIELGRPETPADKTAKGREPWRFRSTT
jgi:coenzyme F420-reducing hydrogenase gamma subunit